MLLRLGIVVVAVLLAIFFLNSLLEIIISILMIGIGILVLAVLGGIKNSVIPANITIHPK